MRTGHHTPTIRSLWCRNVPRKLLLLLPLLLCQNPILQRVRSPTLASKGMLHRRSPTRVTRPTRATYLRQAVSLPGEALQIRLTPHRRAIQIRRPLPHRRRHQPLWAVRITAPRSVALTHHRCLQLRISCRPCIL